MSSVEILAIVIWVGLAFHLALFWFDRSISKDTQEMQEEYDKRIDEITHMYEIDYESDRERVDALVLELQKQIKQVKEERNGEH